MVESVKSIIFAAASLMLWLVVVNFVPDMHADTALEKKGVERRDVKSHFVVVKACFTEEWAIWDDCDGREGSVFVTNLKL